MKFLYLFVILLFCSCKKIKTKSSFENKVELYEIKKDITINESIRKILSQNKVPILYFHADWCKPCLGFKKSLDDIRMIKAFDKALLLGVNLDSDPQQLAIQYSVSAVPTFIKLDSNTNVLAKITSAEWEEDIAENIAPIMDKLINSNFYDVK
ncbi:MAG: thioredoxin family protein [Flavobacteriales bacterium]